KKAIVDHADRYYVLTKSLPFSLQPHSVQKRTHLRRRSQVMNTLVPFNRRFVTRKKCVSNGRSMETSVSAEAKRSHADLTQSKPSMTQASRSQGIRRPE